MGKLGIDFGTTNSLAVTYDKTDGQAYISDMRLVNWEG